MRGRLSRDWKVPPIDLPRLPKDSSTGGAKTPRRLARSGRGVAREEKTSRGQGLRAATGRERRQKQRGGLLATGSSRTCRGGGVAARLLGITVPVRLAGESTAQAGEGPLVSAAGDNSAATGPCR